MNPKLNGSTLDTLRSRRPTESGAEVWPANGSCSGNSGRHASAADTAPGWRADHVLSGWPRAAVSTAAALGSQVELRATFRGADALDFTSYECRIVGPGIGCPDPALIHPCISSILSCVSVLQIRLAPHPAGIPASANDFDRMAHMRVVEQSPPRRDRRGVGLLIERRTGSRRRAVREKAVPGLPVGVAVGGEDFLAHQGQQRIAREVAFRRRRHVAGHRPGAAGRRRRGAWLSGRLLASLSLRSCAMRSSAAMRRPVRPVGVAAGAEPSRVAARLGCHRVVVLADQRRNRLRASSAPPSASYLLR